MTTVEAKPEEEDKKEPDSVSDPASEAATTPASDSSSRVRLTLLQGFESVQFSHCSGTRGWSVLGLGFEGEQVPCIKAVSRIQKSRIWMKAEMVI